MKYRLEYNERVWEVFVDKFPILRGSRLSDARLERLKMMIEHANRGATLVEKKEGNDG